MHLCPICRAGLNGALTCRRCRADLTAVEAVERRGQALAVAGVRALVEGNTAGAAHWLRGAQRMHATPMVHVLEALVNLATDRENQGAGVVVPKKTSRTFHEGS
jgi:hypothetical protein